LVRKEQGLAVLGPQLTCRNPCEEQVVLKVGYNAAAAEQIQGLSLRRYEALALRDKKIKWNSRIYF
jgi:hypothetical protein